MWRQGGLHVCSRRDGGGATCAFACVGATVAGWPALVRSSALACSRLRAHGCGDSVFCGVVTAATLLAGRLGSRLLTVACLARACLESRGCGSYAACLLAAARPVLLPAGCCHGGCGRLLEPRLEKRWPCVLETWNKEQVKKMPATHRPERMNLWPPDFRFLPFL
jgi:hypothetical protein